VQIVTFRRGSTRAVPEFGSIGVTLAPLTEPLVRGAPLQAACFRVEAGGIIGRHPATVEQLLVVIDGSGWVSGADGERRPITAGEAAFWEAGEEHETTSDEGLTAIVIESSGLRPFRA
jgi:quercetin dioxygenase-like cupin family protein